MTNANLQHRRVARDDHAAPLRHRAHSEFLEMPGLRLTPAQAARLCSVDRGAAEETLDALAAAGFLFRNRDGAYHRA